jgi:hypothetical protein
MLHDRNSRRAIAHARAVTFELLPMRFDGFARRKARQNRHRRPLDRGATSRLPADKP